MIGLIFILLESDREKGKITIKSLSLVYNTLNSNQNILINDAKKKNH